MITLLPTKFHLPSAPEGFITRPQLLEKLDAVLGCRLALVSAPAGSGKTIAASAWARLARQKGIRVSWLSLDAEDNDRGRFEAYLAACLLGEEGPPPPAEDFIPWFVQQAAGLKQPHILILDDFHLIQNANIVGLLEGLIERLPPQLHLMLLTRSDPALELARRRVAGQMVELRMEQLRFSPQEAALFVYKNANVQLSETDVAILNTRAEGWVAGLQLAAISLRGRQDIPAFISAFAGSHRFVFDYLLEEVLNRQTPEMRRFLLETSVLERFCAPLCAAVCEAGASARGLLDQLERSNLFLVPLDDERNWYRYHHLFAGALRWMLAQSYPDLPVELHRRASRWFETQDLLPEALQHAFSTGDLRLAERLVSENVLLLLENEDLGSLLQKMDAAPLRAVKDQPWLGIARAWSMGGGQVQKSHLLLNTVEEQLAGIADSFERRRLEAHLAAARVFVFSAQGDQENVVAQAQIAEALLPADEIAVRAIVLVLWGDILSRDAYDPKAIPILERALDLAMKADKPHVAMIALAALALGHHGAGRINEAERLCREAMSLAEDYQARMRRPIAVSGVCAGVLARVYYEQGNLEQAVLLGRKAVALCERWGQEDSEEMNLNYFGHTLMAAGYREQGWETLQRAEQISHKISPWLWHMSLAFALEALLDSDPPDEARISRQVQRIRENQAQITPALQARLLLREGRPGEALTVIDAALTEMAGQLSFYSVRLYILRALACQARREEKQALVDLRRALELAEPEGRVMSFIREGRPMEELLQRALAKAICPAWTRRLLAFFEQRRRPAQGGLVEPLSERELEILRCLNSPSSIPEIAGVLMVSANTARTHIKNIYAKLGVHGRSEALYRARELGLLGKDSG